MQPFLFIFCIRHPLLADTKSASSGWRILYPPSTAGGYNSVSASIHCCVCWRIAWRRAASRHGSPSGELHTASCKPPALLHKNAQYIAREFSFTRTIILLEYIVWCKLVISQFILCVKCTDDYFLFYLQINVLFLHCIGLMLLFSFMESLFTERDAI